MSAQHAAQDAVSAAIDDYVCDYEMRGDGGDDYKPNAVERRLIEDAIRGLLVDDDFLRALRATMTAQAAHDVLLERQRQVRAEGYTPEHDDEHADGSLAVAACCYAEMAAMQALAPERAQESYGPGHDYWPWNKAAWRPSDARRNLIKAGALILAEIERLDRAASPLRCDGCAKTIAEHGPLLNCRPRGAK